MIFIKKISALMVRSQLLFNLLYVQDKSSNCLSYKLGNSVLLCFKWAHICSGPHITKIKHFFLLIARIEWLSISEKTIPIF